MHGVLLAGFRHAHMDFIVKEIKKRESEGKLYIAGACEPDDEARRSAEKRLSIVFTDSDYSSLLRREGNIVAVGDYFGARSSIVLKALRAGKHVFADKPLCTDIEELCLVDAERRKRGLAVGCMLDLRCLPCAVEAKRYVSEGRIGEIRSVYFAGQHPLNFASRPAWYREPKAHGGTINDIGIHGIDLVKYITGLDVAKVDAARCYNGFSPDRRFRDCAQFMLRLDNGAGVIADVSYSSPDSIGYSMPQYWRFDIRGTHGVLEFEYNSPRKLFTALDGEPKPKIVECSEEGENPLDAFLAEIDGIGGFSLGTEAVISASRQTLEIQKLSHEQE